MAGPKKAKSKPRSTRKSASGKAAGKSASAAKGQAEPVKKATKPAGRDSRNSPGTTPARSRASGTTGQSAGPKAAKSAARASGDGRVQAPRSKPRTSPLSRALVAAQGDGFTVVEEGRKLPRTKLSRKQLREFRELLLAKRRELVGNVGNLTDEALGRNRRDAAGDLSAMPIHMADLGSDNWEQEFTLGLIDNERKLLREIDEALARIEDGTYGICLATHTPIASERLRAKPWAKYCIEYARARETGRIQ